MNDLFNNIGNTINDALYDLDSKLHPVRNHNKILEKIGESFIDDFIHELRNHLAISNATYQLSKLPKDTVFQINEAYDHLIDCYIPERYDTDYEHCYFDIPRRMFAPDIRDSVTDNHAYVKLLDDGFYHTFSSLEDLENYVNN